MLIILATATLGFAGIDEYYTFNITTGSYTPLTSGSLILVLSSDEAISSPISIGFSFPYGDNVYTDIKISSNGWISLGTSQTSAIPINNLASTTVVPVLAPLWDDCSLLSGFCRYRSTGTAPNRVFTIQYARLKWDNNSSTLFDFQVRLYESGKIDFVYGTSTGVPNNPSASIGINMLPGGSGWFYSVTPGTPSTFSTTVSNDSVTNFPTEGTIYEFNPVVAIINDLGAISITGPTTPTVGESYGFEITIRNFGSNSQGTYQVKLLAGTQEVSSVNGNIIQPGEIQTYTLSWTPTTAGPATIYGKVILDGDEIQGNNQSQHLDVDIQTSEIQSVTIGSGDQLARVPMDFHYKNSLFECLFYPEELGFVSGTITSLAFYNNFADSPANGTTKIWLGTTNQADLSAGWIPSTELTLVFDGNVVYPSGINTIIIPLQTPYTHIPGNLVMMVQRPMDTEWYSTLDYFYAQTIGISRARTAQNDLTEYDPINPQEGTLSGQFPKITIIYERCKPLAPQNLVLNVNGYDLILIWDEVTMDIYQNPINISYYEVYASDTPYFECNLDTLLCTTEIPSIFLEGAAEYSDKQFFKVKAVSGSITKNK
jgi:hypothetical protein